MRHMRKMQLFFEVRSLLGKQQQKKIGAGLRFWDFQAIIG